jgi:IS5 family transposase
MIELALDVGACIYCGDDRSRLTREHVLPRGLGGNWEPEGFSDALVTGRANEADITKLDGLLHGGEKELYGDQAYWSEDHRQHCQHAGIRYRVNRRPKGSYHPLTDYQRTINRARSRCRARGEHAFHVVKRLWGFAKVRYRGLAKNTARAFALFALANLYLVRRRLLARGT